MHPEVGPVDQEASMATPADSWRKPGAPGSGNAAGSRGRAADRIAVSTLVAASAIWCAFQTGAQVPGILWSSPGLLTRILLDSHAAQWFPVLAAIPVLAVTVRFRWPTTRSRPSARPVIASAAAAIGVTLVALIATDGGPGSRAVRYGPLVVFVVFGAAIRVRREAIDRRRASRGGGASWPDAGPGGSGRPRPAVPQAGGSGASAFARGGAIAGSVLILLIGGFIRTLAEVEQAASTEGFAGLDVVQSIGADGADHPVVDQLPPNGPAARSGLRDGDVILQISGTTVATSADVVRAVSSVPPGTRIDFLVLRGGEELDFTVVTISRLDGLRAEADQDR